jgi:hypothetical protein
MDGKLCLNIKELGMWTFHNGMLKMRKTGSIYNSVEKMKVDGTHRIYSRSAYKDMRNV